MKFPTQLTVLRILLAPVFFILLVIDPPEYLFAVITFAVASVTDWYDGYFARKLKQVTPLGSFLDPLADKILTSVAFIAFATIGLIPAWTVYVIIGRDVLMTIFRMIADANNFLLRTSNFAKVKTAAQMIFVIGVLFVLICVEGTFGTVMADQAREVLASKVLDWGIVIVVALTVLTFVQYLIENAAFVRMSVAKYLLGRGTSNS